MRQGWKILSLCAALAMSVAVVAPAAHAAASKSATASKSGAGSGASKKIVLHQFSGVVTALDKSTLTVEKGGKKPKTMVFVKHAEMSVVGDIEKQARVTVHYRDEDGRPTAHHVVVREPGVATR